ncbi:lactoylglutathione lyase [Tatumella ptyseos ATCC 33301]|uniref:Lactoylglutathione lyase n=2 Tax=Tatumella ptyseos TaxID=82987 RepID=A0A085JJC7_9GAMM|nr:lactoylglutathione lyase [Tatumella ptyseos]KFD20573.1 lactoylglutathione lyase [Tatumella ptyseos ATCC 33301]SQK76787.1 Lactoylglutathione lyase [Tatumella ptyseos]
MPLSDLIDKYRINAGDNLLAAGYVFNHTMIRVKDLPVAIDFYSRVLGFIPVYEERFEEAAFTIVYLVRRPIAEIPQDDEVLKEWVLSQPGVLELTWNHGTEKEAGFSYHDGNSDPQGFGHICVTVPDVRKACERFEQLSVPFRKKLSEGRMKYVAFIKDPDGYWIEILQPTPLAN